jgi:hypothetical protein
MAAACGAIIIVCLFVMKFVGPPPHAFVLRTGLAFVMMTIALYADLSRQVSTSLPAINVVLGLVLLAWYARE